MPFKIVRNDITNMRVDAIVNTSSIMPGIGSGVDAGVHRKAGPKLLEARQAIGRIPVGSAAITPGFELPAKYVIHTVGPVWQSGWQGEEMLLRSCYQQCLALAKEHGLQSLAFPLLSAGNLRFPKDLAMQIAMAAISEFLMVNEMQVYLVVFGREAFQLSEKLFRGVSSFIDENYVQETVEKQRSPSGRAVPPLFCNRNPSQQQTLSKAIEIPPREASYKKPDSPASVASPPPLVALEKPPIKADSNEADRLRRENHVQLRSLDPMKGIPPTDSHCPGPAFPNTPKDHSLRTPVSLDLEGPLENADSNKPELFWDDFTVQLQCSDLTEDISPADDHCCGIYVFDTPEEHPSFAPARPSLEELLKKTDSGFSETLLRLIDESGKKDAEIYNRANVSRQHFSKIRNNPAYKPTKATAIAFAIALELDLEETKDLIGRADYALTQSSKFDVIIMYFIQERNYNMFDTNAALFQFDQSLLGGCS